MSCLTLKNVNMKEDTRDQINALLSALNLSQREFAERVGVGVNAVTNWKARGIKSSSFEKIITAFPNVNLSWLKTGEGDIFNVTEQEVCPHIPTLAAAGGPMGFSEAIKSGDCEMRPVVRILPKYDYTISIKGDSMEPKFESGDVVAIRKVSDFIEWGKTYVLDTEDGAVIKRLYDENDSYRCVSYNSEYPDFLISKASVFGVYKVVGMIRI